MPFNVWDQAVLTELVNRDIQVAWEQQPSLARMIAPMFSVQDRVIRLDTVEVHSFGKGQFKAPDGTPGLYTPTLRVNEEGIELALLEEMTVVQESLWHRLNSNDLHVRRAAGVDMLTRAKILQLRNERLTDWMFWQAVQGSITLTYPDTADTVVVSYPIPSANKPTAPLSWADLENSNPISDLRAWQLLTGESVGYYGTQIHMNSNTWALIQFNQNVRAYLGQYNRDILLPEMADVQRLLWANTSFYIYDGGYREVTAHTSRGFSAVTKYIPDGVVFITTPYSIDGDPIADIADGLVALSTGYNELSLAQGTQSEVIVDHRSKAHYWRQASARMPRIRRPGAFVWANVF
jgi:hypothetical protein